MKHTINVKELRASLPDIIRKVRLGDQYVVLHRSRPALWLWTLKMNQPFRYLMIPSTGQLPSADLPMV